VQDLEEGKISKFLSLNHFLFKLAQKHSVGAIEVFEIIAKRRVLKALKKLNEGRRKRFREIFLILKRNPIPFRELDVVKLRGYENTYRIRVGDYRMVYEILWAERRIIVHHVAHREKAYRGMG